MTLDGFVRLVRKAIVLVFLVTLFPAPSPVQAAPQLWLPTPVGEQWGILQGFYCGTHVGSQTRSLDFINFSGPTRGAPVRAAARGTTFVWQGSTGTLILSHGGGYYTMYTHLQNPITTRRGMRVRQGQQIGEVGTAGTVIPHLHFLFFYAPDRGAYQRTPLELDFADGYTFHDTSGCSQHVGETVVAQDNPDTTPPTVTFTSDLEPDHWYCEDQRIEFHITDDQWTSGFSQKFNEEPPTEGPEFEGESGYVQLAWAGEGLHHLNVRAWDDNGLQTLATFGPVGYDVTAPVFDIPETLPEKIYRTEMDNSVYISWDEASDGNGAGVKGYYYYLGTDRDGTSANFTEHPGASIKDMQPGCYLLRVQAEDKACSKSEWTTVQQVRVSDKFGRMAMDACQFVDEPSATDEDQTKEPTTTVHDPSATGEEAAIHTTTPTMPTTTTTTIKPTEAPTETPTETPTASDTPGVPTEIPTNEAPTETPTASADSPGEQPETGVPTIPTSTATPTPTPENHQQNRVQRLIVRTTTPTPTPTTETPADTGDTGDTDDTEDTSPTASEPYPMPAKP
jgi:hypothetical protein